jgi:hypothetical protein
MRTPSSRPDTVWLLALVAVLAPGAAWSQAPDTAGASPRRPWTLGPYVGVSRDSPVGRFWGLTPDRNHLLVGVRATFPLLQSQRWTFAYAPEVIPLIVVTNNPTYRTVPSGPSRAPDLVPDGRAPVAGAGIAPIGLELQWSSASRFGVFAGGTMGGLWFTRRIPVANARAFNFTFDFGGGIRWRLEDDLWLRAGYKFHHLSNAKTAPENPGVDAKVFYLGIEKGM